MDSFGKDPARHPQGSNEATAAAIAAVAEALSRLRFGAIELTVHDGRVVQLDVTERRRFS